MKSAPGNLPSHRCDPSARFTIVPQNVTPMASEYACVVKSLWQLSRSAGSNLAIRPGRLSTPRVSSFAVAEVCDGVAACEAVVLDSASGEPLLGDSEVDVVGDVDDADVVVVDPDVASDLSSGPSVEDEQAAKRRAQPIAMCRSRFTPLLYFAAHVPDVESSNFAASPSHGQGRILDV